MPSFLRALGPDAPPKAAFMVGLRFLALSGLCALLAPLGSLIARDDAPPAAGDTVQASAFGGTGIAPPAERPAVEAPPPAEAVENPPSRSEPLARAAAKIAGLGKDPQTRFTVLHVGDSHVQYGEFPGAARAVLQAAYGDAGRGFVFPYALTGTDGPRDTRFTTGSRWDCARIIEPRQGLAPGMSGYALSLKDGAASLDFAPIRQSAGRTSSLIRVFSRAGPAWSYSLEDPSDPGNRALPASGNGYRFAAPLSGMRLRVQGPASGSQPFILDGFSLENGQGGVLYHALGVNSATWKSFAAPGVIEAMAQLEPDLLVFSLGTNESVNDSISAQRVKDAALAVLERARAAMPGADILVVGPGANGRRAAGGAWRPNALVTMVDAGCRQAAQEAGAAYLDWLAEMGGPEAMEDWLRRGLASRDRIHLTEEGYAVQGRFLARSILKLTEGAHD